MEVTPKRAVVLLSGGLDSATVLAIAKAEGYALYALSFSYGQRHAWELEAAKHVAASIGVVQHRIATIDLRAFGGSALTDEIDVPKGREPEERADGIPIRLATLGHVDFISQCRSAEGAEIDRGDAMLDHADGCGHVFRGFEFPGVPLAVGKRERVE